MKYVFASLVIFLLGVVVGAFLLNWNQSKQMDDLIQFSYESDLSLYKRLDKLIQNEDYEQLERVVTRLVEATEITLEAYGNEGSALMRIYNGRHHKPNDH